jgi:hypothetical protein
MKTKIQLSEEEWNLAMNAGILLTKNRVMEKLIEFLGEIATVSKTIFNTESIMLPVSTPWKTPKISRGENYQGLPYLVLDYPRFFFRDDVFAIRTMFWWGNYFSITIHLKGIFCQHFKQAILESLEILSENQFLINTSAAEWNHAIGEEYILISEFGKEKIRQKCSDDSLLKLAVKIPLQELDLTGKIITDYYQLIASVLKINFQVDEKDL